MNEAKRYHVKYGRVLKGVPEGIVGVVMAEDFDRVAAELGAALAELALASEKIDKAWNRTTTIDHKGYIPGALDAWKRPVQQHLPYDFSGNPSASAIQYCNGWNDSGSYWSAHAKDLQSRLDDTERQRFDEQKACVAAQRLVEELQQRLTAADERVDVLETALKKISIRCEAYIEAEQTMPEPSVEVCQMIASAALKPADGPAPTTCTWSSREFSWESTCGMSGWEFTDGGTPGENGMKFCHCCGKPLAVETPDPCACIGCEASKASGSLFCAAHQSAKSRTRAQNPLTAEGLEWMMQNDGVQQ